MNEGDRLLNRYRLLRSLPGRDVVQQWRALDEATQLEVDLLLLPASRAGADALERFMDVHRVVHRLHDVPHLVAVHEVSQGDGLAVAVRDPVSALTLADVPGPLAWSDVAAIGAALGPAILAAGPALHGALLPSDIALDEQGRPVLAPRGAPLNRVVRGTTRAVAPETFRGGGADGPAALYGLGRLLYRLATGTNPSVARSGAPPALPSALRPGIPASFDDAVLALLSHEPARRSAALAGLRPGEVPDLRDHVRRVPIGNVVTTTQSDVAATVRRPADTPAWVVVRPDQLEGLDPRRRSLYAGLAGVPAGVVARIAAEGLPLVIEGSRSRLAAERRARTLSADSGVPIHATSGAALPGWVPLVGTALLALIPLSLAPIAAALGWWFLVAPLLVAATVSVAVGSTVAVGAEQRRSLHRAAARAWALQRSGPTSASAFEPAWSHLADVRVQLASSDLPDAAEVDVRQVLSDLEAELSALEARRRSLDEAQEAVDAPTLRTRLAALERLSKLTDDQVAERRRISRVLADLDAMSGDLATVRADVTRIRDTLTEISAVLGQLGDDTGDEPLARLARTTQAAARESGADRALRAAQRRPEHSR